jgi:E3 ubiquitin-protein ligase RNF115/126
LRKFSRFGRPPASEDVIGSLADFQISEENKDDSKLQACAICQDSFEVGETIKRLPCEHYFHANCIIPWLKQCNSCPVCRAPLSNSEE